MLKFFKNGQSEYIIVDDWLAWNDREDRPAFTCGGEDNNEFWPCIIEKAYAKLYGNYSNIETGKIHLALGDMVDNGFPEMHDLRVVGKNLRVFANMMRKFYKSEAMLGAASPTHEQGHDAKSANGIYQSHAYAILKVEDYNDIQLF